MKYHFIIIVISFTTNFLYSQTDSDLAESSPDSINTSTLVIPEPEGNRAFDSNEALYLKKVINYTKMKKAGITMIACGGASILTGSIMAASADWESYSTPTSTGATTTDPLGGTGLILLGVGIPVTVMGIIFSSIGAKKVKYYGNKLDNFSLNVNTTNEQYGVILTYKF